MYKGLNLFLIIYYYMSCMFFGGTLNKPGGHKQKAHIASKPLLWRALNPSGAETRIWWVNIMADDDLAPYVARSSAAMILTMQVKQVLVFHEERFQLIVPSQFW